MTSSTNKYELQYFVFCSSNFRVAVSPGRVAPSSLNKVHKLGVVAGVPLWSLCGVPGLVFMVMIWVCSRWQFFVGCRESGGLPAWHDWCDDISLPVQIDYLSLSPGEELIVPKLRFVQFFILVHWYLGTCIISTRKKIVTISQIGYMIVPIHKSVLIWYWYNSKT